MWLCALIAKLEKEPDRMVVRGFNHPHSYRGYYDRLAFAPASNVSIRSMLACAREANGATYQGYKGGEYEMGDLTDCYLASYGNTGDELSAALLDYMLHDSRPWGEETR